MLSEDIGILKGCSFNELKIIFLIPFVLFIVAGLLFQSPYMPILGLVVGAVAVFIGSATLQTLKRNKIRGYYAKKYAVLKNDVKTDNCFNSYSQI